MLKRFKSQNENTRETPRSSIKEEKTLHEEDGPVPSNLMNREAEVGSRVKSVAEASAYRIEGKSLDVLQVNCRVFIIKH